MESWDLKLKRLQDSLSLTMEGLAGNLGITPRTLSDFMKPSSEGGREPAGPVQRLIDLLLGEIESQGLVKRSLLNLVIIHGDFRFSDAEKSVIGMLLKLHSSSVAQRNNEFHYIATKEDHIPKVFEDIKRGRVQLHIFSESDQDLDTNDARDCYFTTTATWLITQAMERNLAHITFAADAMKFWPLAKELKELAGVDVTFIRETLPIADNTKFEKLEKKLEKDFKIGVLNPSSGRRFGRILTLKALPSKPGISFGYIRLDRKEFQDEDIPSDTIFFSWNHMKKDRTGNAEMDISNLEVDDYVSFSIGMNNKGVCATDVALVERASSVVSTSIATSMGMTSTGTSQEENELTEMIKDAISVCAGENGWALQSAIGSRMSIQHPHYKEILPGFTTIKQFALTHTSVFEYSHNGDETQYSAACLRVKK